MTVRRHMLPERGDPVIRTVPRPADINANGHIFGGWVLSQMDIAGGILARRRCASACATVSIESMSFIAPVLMGDIVSVYGVVEKVGRSSMTIRLEVFASRMDSGKDVKVTEGIFTFVALDDDFHPHAVDRD